MKSTVTIEAILANSVSTKLFCIAVLSMFTIDSLRYDLMEFRVDINPETRKKVHGPHRSPESLCPIYKDFFDKYAFHSLLWPKHIT
jgi:hypothetical protein